VIRSCRLAVYIFLLIAPNGALAQNPETSKDCPYEILGICDPFVPGIMVTPEGKVVDVWSRSPAETSGICPGDIVKRIDDEPFSVKSAIRSKESPSRITIVRNNEELERFVGRVKESELRTLSGTKELATESGYRGVPIYQTEGLPQILQNRIGYYSGPWARVASLNSKNTLDKYFLGIGLIFLPDKGEAIVETVEYPSPSYDAHLQIGDQILSINGKKTKEMTEEEIRAILESSKKEPVIFGNKRKEGILEFTVTPMKISEALARINRTITPCGPVPVGCTCSRSDIWKKTQGGVQPERR